MPNTNTIVYTNNKHYQDIADAIREKNGTENTYTPAEMAEAILALDASGQTYQDGDALGYGLATSPIVDVGKTDYMLLEN